MMDVGNIDEKAQLLMQCNLIIVSDINIHGIDQILLNKNMIKKLIIK